LGVADANADLTRAYLVSTAVLDPGPNPRGESAVSGQANLYHYEQGEGFSFVSAKLGSEANWLYAHEHFSRRFTVSPDARQIAFVTRGSPTGYDNTDAQSSGRILTEVFLHSSVSGELHCVSCPPSGERSAGVDKVGFDGLADSTGRAGVGAWISPWRNGSLYSTRLLSDDGQRLFFNSAHDILPRDQNGRADVYQWQAPGSGECTTEHPHYFAQNGGCLALVSTGTFNGDSLFIEASPDGETVFLRTGQSLRSQDPGLDDIYAARVGGGFPEPPAAEVPCEGEACRGASPATPTAAGAGSAVFEGRGNPAAKFPRPNSCNRFNKKAKRKAAQARKAKGKRAHKLRKQSNNLKRRAKRCNRRASR
jgi:hypothetical protein